MKNVTLKIALVSLFAASATFAGLSQTSHGATSSAAASVATESSSCGITTPKSRADLAANVAAVNQMIVEGTPVSDSVLLASSTVELWLSTTEFSKRRVAAPSADVQVLSNFAGTLPACNAL